MKEFSKNGEIKTPLADFLRPKDWNNFFGQEEITKEDSFLRRLIKKEKLPSVIFWGPPGVGKTTLAWIIAQDLKADFIQISAVVGGKKDLLLAIQKAKMNQRIGQKTILFIDEIHRWNKAQQDGLLPFLEKGIITLIGATTENPSFEINSALLSRLQVIVLKPLSKESLRRILYRAKKILEEQGKRLKISEKVERFLINFSNGDARMMLNILEICLAEGEINPEKIKQILQKRHFFYDKNGEEHYNLISALHKSMRGNNPHAALYYLARMLEGGEDPLYIARRLVRFAAEDVGLADNHALILANAVFEACHKLGMPECEVHLAQLVIYLAKTKKSILAYEAFKKAKEDVRNFGNLSVPLQLRNPSTKLMQKLGYGKNYKYSPKEDDKDQEYFPKEIKGRRYF